MLYIFQLDSPSACSALMFSGQFSGLVNGSWQSDFRTSTVGYVGVCQMSDTVVLLPWADLLNGTESRFPGMWS